MTKFKVVKDTLAKDPECKNGRCTPPFPLNKGKELKVTDYIEKGNFYIVTLNPHVTWKIEKASLDLLTTKPLQPPSIPTPQKDIE